MQVEAACTAVSLSCLFVLIKEILHVPPLYFFKEKDKMSILDVVYGLRKNSVVFFSHGNMVSILF